MIGAEFVQDGDLEEIHADVDFLGVNFYTTRQVRAGRVAEGACGWWSGSRGSCPCPPHPWAPGRDGGASAWRIPHGEGLGDSARRSEENCSSGCATNTVTGPSTLRRMVRRSPTDVNPVREEVVHDPERVEYLQQHFIAAHEAIAAGVDLRGYFVWSLLDNFEWADGYSQRFGVVFVDYRTQERIPKTSAAFMAQVAQDNAVSPRRAPAGVNHLPADFTPTRRT